MNILNKTIIRFILQNLKNNLKELLSDFSDEEKNYNFDLIAKALSDNNFEINRFNKENNYYDFYFKKEISNEHSKIEVTEKDKILKLFDYKLYGLIGDNEHYYHRQFIVDYLRTTLLKRLCYSYFDKADFYSFSFNFFYDDWNEENEKPQLHIYKVKLDLEGFVEFLINLLFSIINIIYKAKNKSINFNEFFNVYFKNIDKELFEFKSNKIEDLLVESLDEKNTFSDKNSLFSKIISATSLQKNKKNWIILFQFIDYYFDNYFIYNQFKYNKYNNDYISELTEKGKEIVEHLMISDEKYENIPHIDKFIDRYLDKLNLKKNNDKNYQNEIKNLVERKSNSFIKRKGLFYLLVGLISKEKGYNKSFDFVKKELNEWKSNFSANGLIFTAKEKIKDLKIIKKSNLTESEIEKIVNRVNNQDKSINNNKVINKINNFMEKYYEKIDDEFLSDILTKCLKTDALELINRDAYIFNNCLLPIFILNDFDKDEKIEDTLVYSLFYFVERISAYNASGVRIQAIKTNNKKHGKNVINFFKNELKIENVNEWFKKDKNYEIALNSNNSLSLNDVLYINKFEFRGDRLWIAIIKYLIFTSKIKNIPDVNYFKKEFQEKISKSLNIEKYIITNGLTFSVEASTADYFEIILEILFLNTSFKKCCEIVLDLFEKNCNEYINKNKKDYLNHDIFQKGNTKVFESFLERKKSIENFETISTHFNVEFSLELEFNLAAFAFIYFLTKNNEKQAFEILEDFWKEWKSKNHLK